MKIIDLVQGSPEWHSWRRNKVGASDVASIMGIGYLTPFQCYLNKQGLYETEVNYVMQKGHDLEPIARKLYIETTGVNISPVCVESSEIPFMAASLDGIDDDKSFIVEIKTGGLKLLQDAINGVVDKKHYCQIQDALFVTGLDKAHLFVYNEENHQGHIVEIHRNTKYITSIVQAVQDFWNGVLNFIPPPLTNRDYVDMSENQEWDSLCKELIPLQNHIQSLLAREKYLKDSLKEIANGNSCVGSGITLTKVISQGRVDYSKIKEIKGIDLNQYRGEPVVSWRTTKKD